MHPTVKPVGLVADAILDCSRRGDLVLDSLGGSGTTLIACERTNRKARLIGIDPIFRRGPHGRWLLHIHDRINGNAIPLTQEALSQLLGVRRTTGSAARRRGTHWKAPPCWRHRSISRAHTAGDNDRIVALRHSGSTLLVQGSGLLFFTIRPWSTQPPPRRIASVGWLWSRLPGLVPFSLVSSATPGWEASRRR
jgi:hypothetical protein